MFDSYTLTDGFGAINRSVVGWMEVFVGFVYLLVLKFPVKVIELVTVNI